MGNEETIEAKVEERGMAVPALADDQIVALAQQADKRIKAMRQIKMSALGLTNLNDWVDENGKPYLQESGGNKIARAFGISWRIIPTNIKKIPHDDGHYSFEVMGEFELPPASIDAMGTRCSRSSFFTTRYKGEQQIVLPPEEVDENNVKKSAIANCIANGVTRLLGLRNLTWEEVQEITGFGREDVTNIQYKKKGKSSGGGTGDSTKKISKAQRGKLWAMMKEKGVSDDDAKGFFEATVGKEPTMREASNFIEKFDQLYEDYFGKAPEEGPPSE